MTLAAELNGTLAGAERQSDPPITRKERIEGCLYFALCCAREARLNMERLSPISDAYLYEKLHQEGWQGSARKHLDTLFAEYGPHLDDTLREMLIAEGIA